jgi:hypothetical protein
MKVISWIFVVIMANLSRFCNAFVARQVHASISATRSVTSLNAQGDNNQRQSWDFFRFVKQSSRFVSLFPIRGAKSSSSSSSSKDRQGKIQPGTVLWKAGDTKNNDFDFAPLDDVVMGGVSSSNFDTATGKWKGIVTDANNGGFIGIRSTPFVDYDLSACKGIEWTFAGTDNDMRLKVVLRDSTEFNGVGWTSSKDTTKSPLSSFKTLVTLKIPFDKQIPTRFAKIVQDYPPFNKASVKAFQLTYSKFEYDGALNPKFQRGDFELQLLEIRSY